MESEGVIMKNEIGDKCFVDSLKVFRSLSGKYNCVAEVDGVLFDSREYPNNKAWLQAIINRTYDCAMGKLN